MRRFLDGLMVARGRRAEQREASWRALLERQRALETQRALQGRMGEAGPRLDAAVAARSRLEQEVLEAETRLAEATARRDALAHALRTELCARAGALLESTARQQVQAEYEDCLKAMGRLVTGLLPEVSSPTPMQLVGVLETLGSDPMLPRGALAHRQALERAVAACAEAMARAAEAGTPDGERRRALEQERAKLEARLADHGIEPEGPFTASVRSATPGSLKRLERDVLQVLWERAVLERELGLGELTDPLTPVRKALEP